MRDELLEKHCNSNKCLDYRTYTPKKFLSRTMQEFKKFESEI